ncbi:MAG TPA: DUF6798 domain-containing protein, partial [Pirellulales bacterium]|nr:DUF6798 domain-containing protein [Pirellulales bacterium]
ALLRYYWFRMSDVMVPLGVALASGLLLHTWQTTARARYGWALAACLLLTCGHLGQLVWLRQVSPLPSADTTIADLPAWREMCAWAARETPREAVFLTPRLAQTFRWYSARSEVVNRKDIPQDAPGIVEWWRRLQRLHLADVGTSAVHWRHSLAELGATRLRELGREFDADYVITTAEPALALERVGPQNASYAIYRLSDGPAQPANRAASSPNP